MFIFNSYLKVLFNFIVCTWCVCGGYIPWGAIGSQKIALWVNSPSLSHGFRDWELKLYHTEPFCSLFFFLCSVYSYSMATVSSQDSHQEMGKLPLSLPNRPLWACFSNRQGLEFFEESHFSPSDMQGPCWMTLLFSRVTVAITLPGAIFLLF